MSNNRIKKLRKITVNKTLYFWLVSDPNCDGDGGDCFKIYLNKKIIYEDLIHNQIITPKLVRDKILTLENRN